MRDIRLPPPDRSGLVYMKVKCYSTACVFEGMVAWGSENCALDRRDTPSREDDKAIRQ